MLAVIQGLAFAFCAPVTNLSVPYVNSTGAGSTATNTGATGGVPAPTVVFTGVANSVLASGHFLMLIVGAGVGVAILGL